jgi:hypothetical protein
VADAASIGPTTLAASSTDAHLPERPAVVPACGVFA